MHNKRLTRELELLTQDKYVHHISAGTVTIEFEVSAGSYKNQRHSITISTADFPLRPPQVHFNTAVWHPNISVKGEVCMDILNDKWSPALSFIAIIKSVQLLLEHPNCESALNAAAIGATDDDVQKKYAELNAEYKFMI